MTNKAITTKARKVKLTKRSLSEDQYNAIFQIIVPGFQPHPLPDKMSLEQPSPFVIVPSIATDAVLEDVTVTETWGTTPNG